MIVMRFKIRCREDKAGEMNTLLQAVVVPSRKVPGVIGFDIARDVTDPTCFIATEVFEDEAAIERQESLPEVAKVMTAMPDSLTADPEVTVYHVSSSEDRS
jgi:quinol monooxygenase YgiN